MRYLTLAFLMVSMISCIETNEGPKYAQTVDISDRHNNMEYFRNHVFELVTGKRKKVRIAYFSDSNNALDYASGYLRNYLGNTFGYGGQGYVFGGRPLSYYRPRNISVYNKKSWKGYQTTIPRSKWYPYGHGGGLGVGYYKGSYVKYSSKSNKPNSLFNKMMVHFLCTSGRFKVVIDNHTNIVVNNAHCKRGEFRKISIAIPLGRHTVKIVTLKPNVAILGTSFERDSGVVVDGFGVGGANIWHVSRINEDLFIRGLKERDYSLVILHLGTNLNPGMSAHKRWMKIVIGRIRKALGPDVSILILSPPPRGKFFRRGIIPHNDTSRVAKEKRLIATSLRCAYWDHLKAAGGPKSIRFWYKKRLFYGDLTHVKYKYHKHMSALLYNALIRNLFH